MTTPAAAPPAALPGPLARLCAFYTPAPPAPPVADPDAARRLWTHWRWRMLAAMFLGYGLLYFCRKNISGALPVLAKDLGYTNTQLGVLGSTLYVTYGIGKFLNGVLADRSNIRSFMATALVASGLVNLWFGTACTLWVLALLWGLNGWVQSMGFPPIARGMTIWYEARGKATRWALWTTSHQAGTTAIMLLTGVLLAWSDGDWRLAFRVPGLLCVAAGVALYFSLADTPQSKGLAPVTAFASDEAEESESYRTIFFRRVLRNRQLWVIALVNLCVYIVRYGTLDWAAKFLVEERGYAAARAAGMAATIPLFGIAGVLVAGFASDAVFKGRFRTVNAVMLGGLVLALAAFYLAGPRGPVADFAFLALVGFCVEGPQSLLGGIASVETGGSAKVASAAAGLVGVAGYAGATLSSLGTGVFVDAFGWAGGFAFWATCAVIALTLCVIAWREPAATAPQAR